MMRIRKRGLLLPTIVLALVLPAHAQHQELEFHGYGDLHFSYFDFGPNQNRPGGSEPDNRGEFDTTRLALEIEGEWDDLIEFEAEIEFEHGGTGSTLELDYEEFGEYETEVEKGGEVVIETLFLSMDLGKHWRIRAGRFYVATGLLPDFHKPTDLIAATRPEVETLMLPGLWNEMGFEFHAKFPKWKAWLQLINGLDSTGFSSKHWVAGGHQQRFESVRVRDLAVAARLELRLAKKLKGGGAFYVGETANNRPKQDLPDVSAPLFITTAYFVYEGDPIRGRLCGMWGSLGNAEDVSSRNARLSNNLGVARTPVSDQAMGIWGEIGWDIASLLKLNDLHLLEPYLRGEYYDTMSEVRDTLFDNPRFERTLATAGVGYSFRKAVTAKLEWTNKTFGTSALRQENTLRLGLGFVF